MPRIYIKETGEYANFPNGMSDQEITKAINEYLGESKKDDGIDVIDSLKAGWGAGWQDAADTGADYLDLVGADQKAEDIRGWVGEQQAEQQFAPEGFVEKLLAGVAAAPGMVAGYTPALGASAAASIATGNPITGTAIGFGAHGAVRGGDVVTIGLQSRSAGERDGVDRRRKPQGDDSTQGGDAIIDAGFTVGALIIQPGNTARFCATAAMKWTVMHKTLEIAAGAELPTGSVTQFAGAAHPTGFLMCDGDEYDELVYPALFAVIGSAWNTGGEQPGFFRVPDFRARVAGGVNPDNGALTFRALGEQAGVEDHDHPLPTEAAAGIGVSVSLNAAGSHKHTVLPAAATDSHTYTGGGWNTSQDGSHTHTVSSASATVPAHNHGGSTSDSSDLNPTLFINYIIKV